jgi:hypothetical protein
MTPISDKSHYTSTHEASSSPGIKKAIFGTPTGIKNAKQKNRRYFDVET